MNALGRFLLLVENETLKVFRRRRFLIVVCILAAITSLVSWGHSRELARERSEDWRIEAEQRVARYRNIVQRGRASESWSRSLRAEIARLEFHLDHDINPERTTAPGFTRRFADAAGFLLLPLLIAVLGSDIVSSESAEGTERLLLTRPVRRWKILLSKTIALFLLSTLTLLTGGVLAWSISSLFLDSRGWEAPVFSGFVLSEEGLQFDEVRQLPLWLDAVIAYGLEWFALLAVASIAILLSVLFRSSAGAMGTMLAALIAGTILTRISPDWTAAKYLFVSALPLPAYYSGQAPPYDGMTIAFCVVNLAAWAMGSLVIAFAIFTRRDFLG